MLSLLKRHRELIVVSVLLVFPFIAFLTRGHKGREPNFVDRTVLWLTSPLQRALTWAFDGVGNGVSGYVALRGAHQSELACHGDLEKAHEELNALREAQAENERLRAYVRYAQETPEDEIVARVIGVNPESQLLSVRINRGEDDGVRAGMPVISHEGVIGRVMRATGSWGDVLLMNDLTSKIGVLDQRSRVRGTASGAGPNKLEMLLENVARTDDVQEGDLLITSGTDGVFPKGLVVGKVAKVERSNVEVTLTAKVVPAVETRRLEEVMVLPVELTPDSRKRPDSGIAAQGRRGLVP